MSERVTPGMLRVIAAGNRGRFGPTTLAETLDNAAATMDAYEVRVVEQRTALRELYDAAVQVVDITNPNLARERRRLSRLLDKYERLATGV